MAMFKSISNGRTGLYQVWYYLLHKNARQVMGSDVFNIAKEEERDTWYKPMDELRKRYGNDANWNGKQAVTYRHYLISPDPKDKCDLPTLREMTQRWIEAFFKEYQVAVVYHNDNGIPHAHIVVNNTNIISGKRLQINNDMRDRAMPNLVQRLSFELGLSPLPNLHPGKPVETAQSEYRSKAERAIKEEGVRGCERKRLSWVAQIREQIECIAKEAQGPLTFDEFRQRMQFSGYDVYQTRRGYTYVHPRGYIDKQGIEQHWKITGKRLGLRYTPYGMARWLSIGAEQPLAQDLVHQATKREAAAFRHYQRLYLSLVPDITTQDRINALTAIVREGVSHMQDFQKADERLRQALDVLSEQIQQNTQRIERDKELIKLADEYQTHLPTAIRLNDYLGNEGEHDIAERYHQAHREELRAFEYARDTLEAAEIKTSSDVENLRAQIETRVVEQGKMAQESLIINERRNHLAEAATVSQRVAEARSQAKQKTAIQYAYRGSSRTSVTEEVTMHARCDEQGRTQYDVIRTKQIHYQKIEAMQQGLGPNQGQQLQQKAQEAARQYGKHVYDQQEQKQAQRDLRER